MEKHVPRNRVPPPFQPLAGPSGTRTVQRGYHEAPADQVQDHRPDQVSPRDRTSHGCTAGGCGGLGDVLPRSQRPRSGEQLLSAVRLIAKLPTIVAAFARIRHGDDHVPPRDDLSFSENFLYMLTERVPDRLVADILDVCLILHAEHTMNASTFCGLVTASTLADPYTLVASAIGALKGPLHGGANEEVVAMLREIGTVERVRPYVYAKLEKKEPIMGFGHRVYKVKDPRAVILQQLTQKLFAQYGKSSLYELAEAVERVGLELLAHKKVYPNVDFYSGIIYDQMGIPSDMFTPVFAMARVAGWLAHWLEQLQENKLYRPDQIYEGEHGRRYLPLDQRG